MTAKQQKDEFYKEMARREFGKTIGQITAAILGQNHVEAQFHTERLLLYLQDTTGFKTIKYKGGGEYENRN
jgi:hypothetical protein